MSKSILVIAAHPDDEVLGCGGAIQHHISQGYQAFVCIVSNGSSTQYAHDKTKAKQKEAECKKANHLLGVKKLIHLNLPDMKLDSLPHAKINQYLEIVCKNIKPEVIYTHSPTDLNLDHQIIYRSTMVVTRPGKKYLRKVYLYEVLSSSEWNTHTPFVPNRFLNIGTFLGKKIAAFECYKTERRNPPHPRNGRGIKILASFRGLQAGITYAEAFFVAKDYVLT